MLQAARDGVALGSWTDTTPLASGGFLSLRTDGSSVQFDDIAVSEVVKYYYLGGQRIAMRRGGTLYYLHSDHLGSTSVASNSAGAEVGSSRVQYYPYGGTRSGGSGLPTEYRYTGQRREPSIGLYDYGARFYEPRIGRFQSPDPIVPSPGDPLDLNRYTYGYGNPVKLTDPTGHSPVDQVPIPLPWLWQLAESFQKLVQALMVQSAPIAGPLTQYGPQLAQFAQGLDAASQASNEAGSFGDPNRWRPNEGPERENRVREMLRGRYQQSFGESDAEIRANLGMQGKTADFVGYNAGNGRWLIAESKGGDMYKAVEQLQNTMQGLLNKTGFQPVDIDLHVYTDAQNFQRLLTTTPVQGGWTLQNGVLGWWNEANQFVPMLINGVQVLVRVVD